MSTEAGRALTPGRQTSEHEAMTGTQVWARIAFVVGVIGTALAAVLNDHLEDGTTTYTVVSALVTICGLVVDMLSGLGYTKHRTSLKRDEIQRGAGLLLVCLLAIGAQGCQVSQTQFDDVDGSAYHRTDWSIWAKIDSQASAFAYDWSPEAGR